MNEILNKALNFHKNGRLEEAKKIYEIVLEKNPNNFEIINLLGVVSSQLKDYVKAINLINKAINIVKNLSTKIQGMKKGPDREKKVAALKQYINNNKNLLKGRDINTLTNGLIG